MTKQVAVFNSMDVGEWMGVANDTFVSFLGHIGLSRHVGVDSQLPGTAWQLILLNVTKPGR